MTPLASSASNNHPITNNISKHIVNLELLNNLKHQESRDLRVFHHHIYEFKRGLRDLVLLTQKKCYQSTIENKLNKHGINYLLQDITPGKINVYFGHQACINVVLSFDAHLSRLTPEQDFILGIMLGYDRLKQCDRYIDRREKAIENV